jgi:hydroxymethylpyrimidine pyrophosphatase-like HAD family hydrolase
VKKLKHSKFKNTGILFELLVRQITADILNDNKKSYANELMRNYFSEESVLGQEQRLYQLLMEETFSDESSAEKFLDVVVQSHSKLNSSELSNARYNLVKEMKSSYPMDDFLRSKIRNYKTYASIYKLFESKTPTVFCDPKEIYESKNTIVRNILNQKTSSVKNEEVVEMYEKQNEDLRLISYKLLVNNFNKKYSSLDESQQTLLKNYINNISNTNSLREYINKEIPKVKKELVSLKNKIIDDKVVSIKLDEVVTQLDNIREGRVVKDSQVTTLLMSYELIKELKKHESS